MFQNGQKVVVVSTGDERRVIKVQSASGTPDPSRYPIVTTDGVAGRDQSVQIVSGGDATRFPILRGVSDARATADSVITALTPAAWYRNATGVTASGGFASQWDDYSGNGRHLVQATGTNQPAYANGIFTFDGADNFMAVAYTANQPRTRYWVGKQVTWTDPDHLLNGVTANVALFQQTATPSMKLFAGSAVATNTDFAVNTLGIVCAVWNGASSSIRVNNATKTTGNAGTSNPGGLTVAAVNTGAGSYGNITALEIIDFAAAHDDATQSSVITALNNALTVF